jgi:hypothetical protein
LIPAERGDGDVDQRAKLSLDEPLDGRVTSFGVVSARERMMLPTSAVFFGQRLILLPALSTSLRRGSRISTPIRYHSGQLRSIS